MMKTATGTGQEKEDRVGVITEHGSQKWPERIVYIEYDREGRPLQVITEYDWDHTAEPWFRPGKSRPTGIGQEDYRFAFSRADGMLYWHNSGSGGGPVKHLTFGELVEPNPPSLFWMVPSIQPTEWVSDEEPRRPLSPAQLLARGFRRLDEPLELDKPGGGKTRDPFEVGEEQDTIYCNVCDDYLTDELEPCGHLHWDEEASEYAGEGSDQWQRDHKADSTAK